MSDDKSGGAAIVEQIGLVVIGRNEGQRLIASLRSLGPHVRNAVYVDSGSTDGSVQAAREMGAQVVELATDIPFTAARARNAGVAALVKEHPATGLVQFIDGDCSLADDWLTAAAAFLADRPDVAIVTGRRRERFPDRSFYNELCDREWDGPKGLISECGGDFMIRMADFRAVQGFRAELIAGEEPELCLRLRERGRVIWRLDREMTLHDANIMQLRQWWRRQMRAGHAFAEVSWLHFASPKRIWQRQFLRSMVWGLALPLIAVALAVLLDWRFLLLLLAYPLNVARIAAREGGSLSAWKSAALSVLGKLPEAAGALKFHSGRLAGKRQALIEYK